MHMMDATMTVTVASPGSNSLLLKVRGDFIAKGTTLTAWCRSNGVDHAHAHRVLRGLTDGGGARALRDKIVRAASA